MGPTATKIEQQAVVPYMDGEITGTESINLAAASMQEFLPFRIRIEIMNRTAIWATWRQASCGWRNDLILGSESSMIDIGELLFFASVVTHECRMSHHFSRPIFASTCKDAQHQNWRVELVLAQHQKA